MITSDIIIYYLTRWTVVTINLHEIKCSSIRNTQDQVIKLIHLKLDYFLSWAKNIKLNMVIMNLTGRTFSLHDGADPLLVGFYLLIYLFYILL